MLRGFQQQAGWEPGFKFLTDISWNITWWDCFRCPTLWAQSKQTCFQHIKIFCHIKYDGNQFCSVDAGWHNLRSFLAANSTQNHFLIAHVKLFVTFATKVCLWHFATKYYNFWYRKSTEREEVKRKWGNLESEFLSTSSFSLHFLFIFSFSLHFLEGRRATQVRDNHNKFRSILNNRKDKHQRYRWEMHITQWRQSTCLRNPLVISVTAHKSCVCVFVTDC